VPGSRYSALLLALVIAACETRDLETKPFQIDATRSDGASFVVDVLAAYRFTGTARRLEPTVLLVEGASLPDTPPFDATLRFRPDAPGGVVFPEQLDGAAVTVVLVSNPAGLGPEGEALRYPSLRIATGADPDLRHQFAMVEAAYTGVGTNIITVGPALPTDDLPFFRVIGDWTEFEPAECGPAYYDALEVLGDDERFTLRHGDRRELSIGAADAAPWKVLHVVSWHRRGTCGAQSEAWTQFAAWR
jgi:hypothetical protein